MRRAVRSLLLAWVLGIASASHLDAQVSVSGDLSGEMRAFPEAPLLAGENAKGVQPGFSGELKLEAPALFSRFNLTVNPYYRYDAVDSGRSVFDLHTVKLAASWDHVRFKAGYDVEFWGVMEFVNPVNVINQRDLTEDVVGKRRLGQPMANVTVPTGWGTVDLYALEGFQPLQFPTMAGRLRPVVPIVEDAAEYVAGNGRGQVEWAARYFHNIRNVYFGVSHFYGYSREPEMIVRFDTIGSPFLVPRYNLEHQTGAELQVTFGNLILKSEDVVRTDTIGGGHSAGLSAGGEYNLGALVGHGTTVSVFGEYYYDGREKSLIIPFNRDAFAGLQLSLNDRRSTEIRMWANYDVAAHQTEIISVDASTRMSDRLKAVVGYRGVVSSGGGAFASVERDSNLVIKLEVLF